MFDSRKLDFRSSFVAKDSFNRPYGNSSPRSLITGEIEPVAAAVLCQNLPYCDGADRTAIRVFF